MRGWLWVCVALALAACAVNEAERNNRANTLYDQGDYNEALTAYQAAQVAAPDVPLPYYNAASALVELNDLQRAEAALQQALQAADAEVLALAYYNLGEVRFRQTDYAGAVVAYQQTLLLNPEDGDARFNLELAMSRLPTPTPPPGSDDNEQSVPTPTPQVGDGDATPTPQSAPGESEGAPQTRTPEPGAGGGAGDALPTTTPNLGAPMSPEEAERRLDAVQQDQGVLGLLLGDTDGTVPLPERDW